MIREFKDFLLKQNALALAIGVIIGGAIGKVVEGIVADVLMPIIGIFLPSGEWRQAQFVISGENAIKYGDLAGRIIDFAIVSVVVFMIMKTALREKPKAATTKKCDQCLEDIPLAAKKCRACASVVA
jgi:large conductance mechanosensitive channel